MKRFVSSKSRLCSQVPSFEQSKEGAHGMEHESVLLAEALEQLQLDPNGRYVDATFGGGGHSQKIVAQLAQGALLAIDKDEAALTAGMARFGERVIFRHGSFAHLKQWTTELGWCGKVSGILLDLGVSSPQLANAERGFSFLREGPLDMRMNLSCQMTAGAWLNKAREQDIAWVLKRYGEEKFSRRIARAIVQARTVKPVRTTQELVNIITAVVPKERTKHPATRTFQALRIYINNELEDLALCLAQSLEVLAVGGRLVVISFHSLEDRLVKRFIQEGSGANDVLHLMPPKVKKVGKFIRPSAAEVARNPRARSAIMRVMEKIA